MIAITGATGKLGAKVLEELLGRVEPTELVAVARSPEKAKDLSERGVHVRQGDYDEPESLRNAFDGVSRVLLVSGTEMERRVQQHANVIDAAEAAGAGHVVYTSVVVAGARPEAVFDDHRKTEEYLLGSGLAYTLLRNGFYMDAYVSEIDLAIERGAYRSPNAGPGSAIVSRADIARAAAAVLAGDDHEGETYALTGPAAVDGPEFARIASAISGREVAFERVDLDAVADDYRGRGISEQALPFMLLLEEMMASGALADVSTAIEDLTGTPPMGFEAFVRTQRA